MRSNCGSPRHVLYIGVWALQVGHSCLHLRKLSLIHSPQKRWLHSGLTSVSVQGSKQTGHWNASSRNFLRDARTEDNVISMRRRGCIVCVLCFGWLLEWHNCLFLKKAKRRRCLKLSLLSAHRTWHALALKKKAFRSGMKFKMGELYVYRIINTVVCHYFL